jgi:hypothetical protein
VRSRKLWLPDRLHCNGERLAVGDVDEIADLHLLEPSRIAGFEGARTAAGAMIFSAEKILRDRIAS